MHLRYNPRLRYHNQCLQHSASAVFDAVSVINVPEHASVLPRSVPRIIEFKVQIYKTVFEPCIPDCALPGLDGHEEPSAISDSHQPTVLGESYPSG